MLGYMSFEDPDSSASPTICAHFDVRKLQERAVYHAICSEFYLYSSSMTGRRWKIGHRTWNTRQPNLPDIQTLAKRHFCPGLRQHCPSELLLCTNFRSKWESRPVQTTSTSGIEMFHWDHTPAHMLLQYLFQNIPESPHYSWKPPLFVWRNVLRTCRQCEQFCLAFTTQLQEATTVKELQFPPTETRIYKHLLYVM